MDDSKTIEIFKQLKAIANYFSKKTPKEIIFADADNYDYEIYGLFQEWQKTFPNKEFKKELPIFDLFWEELATWNYQDNRDHEKCERIIDLAKQASLEIQKYIEKYQNN